MKQIIDFSVVDNRVLNHEHFVLELQSSQPLPQLMPGQFVEVRVDGSPQTFLRRPFSIHDADIAKKRLSLFIKKAGPGTRHLSTLDKGSTLNIILPLGKGFTWPSEPSKVLLTGGGCGIAPLLYLGRVLVSQGLQPHFLLGARTATDLSDAHRYQELGPVELATEDGSSGFHGLVTAHHWLSESITSFRQIYACGPDAMMKQVDKQAKRHNIPCQVSLEHTMACGIGACLTCVADTMKGHLLTCKDGPVFNTNLLKW